jgi:membrane associated rhomboid family serine protease
MYTLLGFGLIVAAIAQFIWATLQFRRAKPPRWTRSDFIANLSVLGLVGGIAFGAAFLIQGVVTGGSAGWAELAGLIILLVVAVIYAQRSRLRRPRSGLTPLAGGAEPGGKDDDQPPRPMGGGRDQRRAA